MSLSSRLLGRRAIAAVVSVGMVTSVVTVAPETFIAPAIAMPPGATPAPGELTASSPTVAAGATVTVTGTGFAARTEGQGLAVDLLQIKGKEKTRFTLPSTVEGSTFDSMVRREGSDIYYGVITSAAKLPTADNKGNFTFTVKIPASTPAGKYSLAVKGGSIGKNAPVVVKTLPIEVTAAAAVKPKVYFGRSDAPNIEATAQGTTVVGTFTKLPENTKVTAVGVLNDEGTAITTNWLPAGEFVANKDGEITVPGIAIPADAPLGKGISATFVTPDGTTLVGTAKRNGITPNVGEKNPELVKILAEKSTPGGEYQSAFDKKTNNLFVTYTDFYNKTSGILKANADTLDFTNLVNIPAPEGDKLPDAVFGVAYDAAHQLIWTSNTEGPTVTVYKVDGTKVAVLPLTNVVDGKNKAHPRDIEINPKTGKVYVSDAAAPGGKIYVFDSNNVVDGAAPEDTISVSEFGDRGPLELTLDEAHQTLWTVGFSGKYIAKVDLAHDNKVTAYSLDNADVQGNRGAGVAIDTKRGKAYAASQEPSHVKVVDLATGKVEKTIVTGASPLDALYDPVKDVVYTINRLSGTINVIDPATYEILATKSIAPYPNQLATDGMGNVFVTTKAYLGRYPVGSKFKEDTLYKITFDKKEEMPADKGDKKDKEDGSSALLSSDKDDNKAQDPKDKKDDSSSNGLSSDKDGKKAQDPKDKKDDSSSEGGSTIGIVAVIAALVAAIGFAFQSGALKQFLPAGFTLPGLPK